MLPLSCKNIQKCKKMAHSTSLLFFLASHHPEMLPRWLLSLTPDRTDASQQYELFVCFNPIHLLKRLGVPMHDTVLVFQLHAYFCNYQSCFDELTMRLLYRMDCHKTQGLVNVINHNCLVSSVPFIGPNYSISIAVTPVHKIFKDSQTMWMLQYLKRKVDYQFTSGDLQM